jgi:hypothetical protein
MAPSPFGPLSAATTTIPIHSSWNQDSLLCRTLHQLRPKLRRDTLKEVNTSGTGSIVGQILAKMLLA